MGIFLIYDVNNLKSLQNIRQWVRNIEGNAPQTINKILIGNKCDVESARQVPRADGEKLAAEYGLKFFETSARTNANVSEAFFTLATDVRALCHERKRDALALGRHRHTANACLGHPPCEAASTRRLNNDAP
mmetsp:Transcript_4724/g.15471  ORF Transcript_4724/g.15471 Transcript_4724/m.15471 type:complete len:132 (-) Transcript_4724:495-890(-)